MKNIYEIIPCVIIAGGKGKRMGGKEKALINLLDRPLISYIIEKVSGKAAPIALNINTNFEKFKSQVRSPRGYGCIPKLCNL